MKNKINNTTIFLISGGLVVILILCVILFNSFKDKNKPTDNNVQLNIKEEAKLPDLSMINSDQNPIMYDFVNSSLTYKWNDVLVRSDNNLTLLENLGMFYAVFYKNEDMSSIFIENYNYGEKITTPLLGTKPIEVKINNQQKESILKAIEEGNISKNRIYNETFTSGNNDFDGNWTLLLISEDLNGLDEPKSSYVSNSMEIPTWCGIPIGEVKTQAKMGLMYNTIYEKGMGFPTEWIKKEPYKSNMLEFSGINIEDPFWNNFNYMQKIHCKSKVAKANDIDIQVVQLERFQVKINKKNEKLNMREIYLWLENNEFEIPTGITLNNYSDISDEEWEKGLNPE